eukprot:2777450-Pyramimonas_sp.AAC.1
MKFKPIEQWALRPTKLGGVCHVEPVVPHPVAVGPRSSPCMSPKTYLGSSCGTDRCTVSRGRTRTRHCSPLCKTST